ncbi:MAG: alpha/beta fold hydrolase, partial [Thermostichus sp. BF3_bins_97]
MLHGIGSHEGDLIQLAPYLDPRFAVLSLRAPIPLSMGGFAWFEMTWTEKGLVGDPAQARDSLKLLSTFLEQLLRAGIPDVALDPTQVYLMGFSQGAIMSLYLALTQPEKLTGIVAMSGRLPAEVVAEAVEPERMKNLAILAVHGTEDAVLPIAFGREIRDYFTRLPLPFTYREYEMGHEVSPQSLSDIQAWLQERLRGKV